MQFPTDHPSPDYRRLARDVKRWGVELGFQRAGITGIELGEDEIHLLSWLGAQRHGEMGYMHRHGTRRSRPDELIPGTIRVISLRFDYLRADARAADSVLADPTLGYVARYALGRDYHRLIRRRLQQLADRISSVVGDFGYRAFVDSAPVLEKALARNAGLGWIGKHTNLLSRDAGSWFFLGEIYTDLPLPIDAPSTPHCGTCRACLDACPTGAIIAPYELDARLCISYLTIELEGAIPEKLRPYVGNRIFGCDDCQLVCPWNRFSTPSEEPDFAPRHGLDGAKLVDLLGWTEEEFYRYTEGMAIRRIGYERWLRNVAVALGNAPTSASVIAALRDRRQHESELVREHVAWALAQHELERDG